MNPTNYGHTDLITVREDSVQIKEEPHHNFIDPSNVHEAAGEPQTGKVISSLSPAMTISIMAEESGRSLGSRQFKTRYPSLLPLASYTTDQNASTSLRPASTEAASEAEVSGADLGNDICTGADDGHIDWGECSYLKFAAAHFQTGALPTYSSLPLSRPLFKHSNEDDSTVGQIACSSFFFQLSIFLMEYNIGIFKCGLLNFSKET